MSKEKPYIARGATALSLKSFFLLVWYSLLLLIFLPFAYPILSWRYKNFQKNVPAGLEGPLTFLVLPIIQWDEVWQRPQQLFSRLAKKYPVIYFNALPLQDVLKRISWFRKNQIREFKDSYLVIFSPLLLPGQNRIELIRILNVALTIAYLRYIIVKYKIKNLCLWTSNPFTDFTLSRFFTKLHVFDIMDEMSAFSFAPKKGKEMENRLLKSVDLAFTGTSTLYSSRKELVEDIHFVPCGVEFEHFYKATDPSLSTIPEIVHLKPPIIGFFGGMNERVDKELVVKLAKAHPEWNIVMVGPIQRSFGSAPQYPNLLFTGLRDYQILPNYLKAFQVCLVPYALNEVTLHVYPVKMLEYLASGKPVVSTAIPDVKEFFSDTVYIAEDHEHFIKLVEQALAEDDLVARERRIQTARSRSWENMAGEMEDYVLKRLTRKFAMPPEQLEKILQMPISKEV